MVENIICPFQEEHIKQLATYGTKIEKLENDISCLNRIDKSIEKLSWLMEQQIQSNDKRDLVLQKMSEGLDNLNVEMKQTNSRMDSLESKFENTEKKFNEAEDKNKIDIRDIQKEEVKLTLGQKVKKAAIPFAVISGLITCLYEILKGIKVIK